MAPSNREPQPLASGEPRLAPSFQIAAIGASAGGLEALERLFDAMPPDMDMAFIIIQHLSPDFESLMDELLGRRTSIPVHRVVDQMEVVPNAIYLLPPRKEMIISEGRLLLTDKEPSRDLTLPIDQFFRALAQDAGSRAIGIILSGTGSDGSRGIKEIHHAGGLVIAQSLDTARFDGMPRSALDTGVVDLVLAPEQIPAALRNYAEHGRERLHPPEAQVEPANEDAMEPVFALLRSEFGIDFSHYKPGTVGRRIERRLVMKNEAGVADYLERLRQDPGELDALYRDLLIGVTRFFRDERAFELLATEVLPAAIKRLPPTEPFRAWVAGCATGEEVYSLAMLVQEQFEALSRPPLFKIFATDVHQSSLDRAATATYSSEDLAEMAAHRRNRFFVRKGDCWQVAPDIRQSIVFARHNIIKDAPFTRLDLVSCRNLLIYLRPGAQKKVLSLMHFGLRPGGILFLGPSETLGAVADAFEPLHEHWRIYRKRGDIRLPAELRLPSPQALVGSGVDPTRGMSNQLSVSHMVNVYDSLLEHFMPPGLLMDDKRRLVHVFGGAGEFLQLGDGRPAVDVLELVHPDLKVPLTGALRRAAQDKSAAVYTGVRIGTGETAQEVKLSVLPIVHRSTGTTWCLVGMERKAAPVAPVDEETSVDIGQVSREQLSGLEMELRYTKENLQATIEELETSNEELQATNQELIASNEELQSTNEELQSVNEELYTVNAEFQKKIGELTQLTNDMDNLFSSTDVGTIFLDRDLRIRKFTPKIGDTFHLIQQDVGRSIESFAHSIEDGRLMDDVQTVLRTQTRIEREVRDRRGSWYFLRLLPYRSHAGVEGVVITLIDTSSLKEAEDALFRERYLLRSLMDTLPDGIYFKDARGRFVLINRALAQRLKLEDPGAAVGRAEADFLSVDQRQSAAEDDQIIFRTGQPVLNKLERVEGEEGSRWLLTSKLPLRGPGGEVVGTFGVSRDITAQKLAEARVRQEVQRRDEFLAMLSHELRNPLGAIMNSAQLLKRASAPGETPRRAVEVITRQAGQMTRLLDDLLEVSRITQNKIELKQEAVDFGAVLTEALQVVQPLMEQRGLKVEVSTAPEPPLHVQGDRARLQQMVVNMLNNAAKYSQSGGRVWINAHQHHGQVVLQVRDEGVGIPPQMLDSIFDLFVQCEHTLDRSAGGMGVGLTLVRSIVELHNGTVTASSDGPGKGAVFEVSLPACSDPPPSHPAVVPAWVPTAGSLNILVIEDDADNRETLRLLLAEEGYHVSVAAEGHQGVELVAQERPDVVLVDVGLPGLDGYQVAKRIRDGHRWRCPLLIALTGYGQSSDKQRAREAGFDEHIVKPLKAGQLSGVLAHFMSPPVSTTVQ